MRPVCRGFSRSATSAAARSSAWPQRSAKAQWSSRRCISTWRRPGAASGRTRSVAGPAAGVSEGHARLRNELPVIPGGAERQPQDAEGIPVAHLAVWKNWRNEPVVMTPSPCADDELADATVPVESAGTVLGRKPLVVVLV